MNTIFSINTDWNNYAVGSWVSYGKISRIENLVDAFEIYVLDENTHEEKLWKLCVVSNYEIEYNLKPQETK